MLKNRPEREAGIRRLRGYAKSGEETPKMTREFLTAAMIVVASVGPNSTVIAAEPAATAPAPITYSTAQTDIGTLLDNPATKAVLEKHVPQLLANEQIAMARVMTLKQVQSYASDLVTDEVLAKIDADLAKIPAKK